MTSGTNTMSFIIISFLATAVLASEDLSQVARGEVQSCRGCSLSKLPEVKTFIYVDLPKYYGVEFHPIPGANPDLVLFDESNKEIERIDLSSYTREKCNELVSKWFSLKEDAAESKEKPRGEL